MNTKIHRVVLSVAIAIGILTAGPARAAQLPPSSSLVAPTLSPSETSGAKIQFADTTYEFGKVNAGDTVRHDFIFTNVGTSTLEIKGVRPACGCTTAGTWDRLVEPGETGVIPLQLRSAGFSGKISKSAVITCNDPNQTNVVLMLVGTVWKPYEVLPSTVAFQVSRESQTNETKIVRIVNNLEEPVELSELQCTNESFQAELKTLKPGKEFALHLTALAPFTSNMVTGNVTLKTSDPTFPLLQVKTYIMLRPSITVTPNIIMLPAGPLTNEVETMVSVHNIGTNVLVITEASVNAPGTRVNIQEIKPGRIITLAVSFPPDFQVSSDEKIELVLKSNHPQYSQMNIPIFHSPSRLPQANQNDPSQGRIIPLKAVQGNTGN